jgi:putative transposon-encoded protein
LNHQPENPRAVSIHPPGRSAPPDAMRCGSSLTKRQITVAEDKNTPAPEDRLDEAPAKVKFEVYGEEMIEKKVKLSGNSGRVYLPPNWVGHQVKIIRID